MDQPNACLGTTGLPFAPGGPQRVLENWWPLVLGVAIVFLASWLRFAIRVWPEPEYSHAPLIICMALYLAWRRRSVVYEAAPGWSASRSLLFYVPGVALYVFGVWVRSGFIETIAQIVLLAGALSQIGGLGLLRAMAIPMLLLLLSAPLPGNVIAAATGSLKQAVSASAETLLYAAGYPIARSGVMLTIGAYQLLVADACSGMNSIFSLSAVGLFYLFLVPRPYAWQGIVLVLAIIPMAILANILRVIVLVLITYHRGDEAGQGFLHEFAGIVMFVISVLGLFALDQTLRVVGKLRFTLGRESQSAARHG